MIRFLIIVLCLFSGPSTWAAASKAPAILACMVMQLELLHQSKSVIAESGDAAEGNGANATQPPTLKDVAPPAALADDSDKYATPQEVIDEVLAYLKPQTSDVILDLGSGDGRFCITAARDYGCKAIGIELEPSRVELARAKTRDARVDNRVTFLEGDFRHLEWPPEATIGYAYLFPADLASIRNKLLSLNRFATFAHPVPGLPMWKHKSGNFYAWDRSKVFSWWDGNPYFGRVCNKSNCSMCASIMRDINEQLSHRLNEPQYAKIEQSIVIRTGPNCPACTQLKADLRRAGIAYTEQRETRRTTIPNATIDGRYYVGSAIWLKLGI